MITVCCSECDWTTDLELTSKSNPTRCPRLECNGLIVLAIDGERSAIPVYIGGKINPDLVVCEITETD